MLGKIGGITEKTVDGGHIAFMQTKQTFPASVVLYFIVLTVIHYKHNSAKIFFYHLSQISWTRATSITFFLAKV